VWEDTTPGETAARDLIAGIAVAICTAGRPASLGRFLASLVAQDRRPEQLIIVDAARDDLAECVVRDHAAGPTCAREVVYVRVSGPLRGLTRQRNHALRLVRTDLVAFFDDDIVLLPGCLAELERAHRGHGASVIGVGAYIENEFERPALRWRIRARTRVVTSLEPGRYFRSGMSTPWSFLPPTQELVEGDWLPGGAVVWRTACTRAIGFNEGFAGYAQGEDLDFSLRARPQGRLLIAGTARVLHLHEPSGRPDAFRRGFMEIHNRYQIHQRALPDRTWRDVAWFIYAWALDTAMLLRHLSVPTRALGTLRQIAGRLSATIRILWDAGVGARPSDFAGLAGASAVRHDPRPRQAP